MSITLSDEQVMNALRDVVAENPDKVYKAPESMRGYWGTCFYVHHNEDGSKEPGCIVGTVLHRLGVSLDALQGQEGLQAMSATHGLGVKGLTDEARYTLRRVQRRQDRGDSWGAAYTAVTGLPVPEPSKA